MLAAVLRSVAAANHKGGSTRAKVLGIHEIRLKPGVSAEEWEQAALAGSGFGLPGVKTYLARGIQGARAGQYVVVFEIESEERLKQLWPEEGMPHSTENPQGEQQAREIVDRFLADYPHTDYVVLKKYD